MTIATVVGMINTMPAGQITAHATVNTVVLGLRTTSASPMA